MQIDPMSFLGNLHRPGLLVRAARHGLGGYQRRNSLRRILPGENLPSPGRAFDRLVEREADIDQSRRDGVAAYSAARHVEILTALLDEARILERRDAA